MWRLKRKQRNTSTQHLNLEPEQWAAYSLSKNSTTVKDVTTRSGSKRMAISSSPWSPVTLTTPRCSKSQPRSSSCKSCGRSVWSTKPHSWNQQMLWRTAWRYDPATEMKVTCFQSSLMLSVNLLNSTQLPPEGNLLLALLLNVKTTAKYITIFCNFSDQTTAQSLLWYTGALAELH